MKETKDMNKWKDISFSVSGRINIVNIPYHPNDYHASTTM